MLQLRRIRTYTKNDTLTEYDTCFEPDILIETHSELFTHLEKYIAQIPEFERYNCHYTLGSSAPGKRRGKGNFISQCLVPFDVDGIEFVDSREENKKTIAQFIDTFFEITGFHREHTLVIFSGGGLHFLLQVAPWTDREYFKKNSKTYASLCTLLEQAFRKVNLKFKELDRMVFTPNHMLRLPGTINRKPNKKDRPCRILQGSLAVQPLDWDSFAKATKGLAKEKSPKTSQKEFPKTDSDAVENGCAFLKACKANPSGVNEAQWYASLSILSRLGNGKEKCHEYSKGHPGYDADACDEKIKSALENTGPRTCENIATLGAWCGRCEWNGKIKSPIAIRSQEFIATEYMGFTKWVGDENPKPIPQVEDLRKFFAREKPYKTNNENNIVYTFNGKKYELFHRQKLRGFAGSHFDPQPNEIHISEFIHRVNRRELVSPKFFEGLDLAINLDNGVLDLGSGKLMEHSSDYGFLYVLPYAYDPAARCPEFDAMMKRVTCNDSELEQLLLEFVGYIICDRTYWLHKALILVGEGSNGKSTFLDVVKALVGRANFSAIGIKEMEDHGKRAMLEGKLVNISDEMPNMRMSDTDTFKKMMGGDITIKSIYEKPTTIRCTTKLMFAANEIPSTYDNSHGLFRRLVIVPFDARFDGKNTDHGLRDKLLKELPGIFNRVLAAYRDLDSRQEREFVVAARSVAELNTYREENDILGSAVQDLLDWSAEIPGDFFISNETLIDHVWPKHDRQTPHQKKLKMIRLALKKNIPDLEQKRGSKRNADNQKIERGYFKIRLREAVKYANGNGKVHGAVPAEFATETTILA